MNTDFIQIVQERLQQGKPPTIKQTRILLERVQAAEALMHLVQPALGDTERERDAYALLAQCRSAMIEHMRATLANQTQQPVNRQTVLDKLPVWNYNLREFFEMRALGWRGVVSSDSEEPVWTAYVERADVRFYAEQRFPFVYDAFAWCEREILRQSQIVAAGE